MVHVVLVDAEEDSGFDSEFETAIERHDTNWEKSERTFELESVSLSLVRWKFETDISCYDENYANGGYGPSMSDYGTEFSETVELRLKGCFKPLNIDVSEPRNKQFIEELFGIEDSRDIVFPILIYQQISDYRIKRNIRNIIRKHT
ncbi:hypothetical protein [Agarilytica rhodophyticola]|uniref:hypothetical protein n=1 Tax=Agarilytica rhodophyticola TaxID=1737490 RepID=UPI000CD9DCD2|nr:hypothetical protein [Agarilytica rhodophyticola]